MDVPDQAKPLFFNMVSTTDGTNITNFIHNCSMTDQDCIKELSFQEPLESPRSSMAQMVIMNIMFILGLFGCVCTIGVLAGTARKDVLSRYVVSRAIAQILLLLTVPLDATTHFYQSWLFGGVMCKFRNSLAFLECFVTSANLVGICINTYIEECISAPNLKLRSAVFKVISFISWSVSLVLASAIFVQSEILIEVVRKNVHCISTVVMEQTWFSHYFRIMYPILFAIVPVTVSWIFLILTILTKKTKFSLIVQDVASGSLTVRRRALQLSFAITIAFTILQLTYFVPYLVLVQANGQDSIESIFNVIFITMSLPALNVVVDVVLYAIFMRDAHKYVKKMSLSTDDQRMVPLIPIE
ncbi:kappa-type opioid receptor-like [Palaemon carinicauda]|uniref:kappa-type opioid receptor-like n=1 Tax=Palaemon carinicauda TaxID=392227 RepID=UPI0035B57135